MLLDETVTSTCAAAPRATVEVACELGPQGEELAEAEVIVTVEDEASATLPASFELEWTFWNGTYEKEEPYEPIYETGTHSFGPLSHGTKESFTFEVWAYGESYPIKVTSAGHTILEESIAPVCAPEAE